MAKNYSETLVVEYDHNGDVDALQKRTRPLRSPAPDEAIVEVVATGISHIDCFIRSGREEAWGGEAFPGASGGDFAGIAVPRDATGWFGRGAEVIGHMRTGAHAEYLVV